MRKLLILAAFLAAPAFAGENPWTYDPSNTTVGNMPMSGATANPIFTPQQFGGNPDTQIISTAVTATSGSTAIHTAYAGWTSANVGDYIVVQDAGAPLATGGIRSVPVATAGANYSYPPVVQITSATGGAAFGRAYMTAEATPTLTAKVGGGCTNGTQTFIATTSNLSTQALTVSATVSGGVVTAVNSVTTPGSYYYFGVGYQTLTSAIPFTGPGCTSNPQFTVNWGVGSVTIWGSGEGYPVSGSGVSVALFGGYGSPSATLSAPVMQATTPPLVARIANVVDANDITVTVAAGNSISETALIRFGVTDNEPAIAAAIAAAPSGGSICFPAATGFEYGVAEEIQMSTSKNVSFGCAASGQQVNAGLGQAGVVSALAPMASVIYKAPNLNLDVTAGTTLNGVSFDGSNLATTVCNLNGNVINIPVLACNNAASGGTNMALGNGTDTTRGVFGNISLFNASGWASSNASNLPWMGLADNSDDSVFNNLTVAGAIYAGVDDEGWGTNVYNNPHVYGYLNTFTNYLIRAELGGLEINSPYMDGCSISCIFVNGMNYSINGGHYQPDTYSDGEAAWFFNTTSAIEIAAPGVSSNFSIEGFKITGSMPASQGITQDGSGKYTNGYIKNNPGASYNLDTSTAVNFGAGCRPAGQTGSSFCLDTSLVTTGLNNSSGANSFVIGSGVNDRGDANVMAFGNGVFGSKSGSAQRREVMLFATMTGSAVTLTSDGTGVPSTTNMLQMPAGNDGGATLDATCSFIIPSTNTGAHTAAKYDFILTDLSWTITAGGVVTYAGASAITAGVHVGTWSPTPSIAGAVNALGATGGPALSATGPSGSEAECRIHDLEGY